MKHINFKSLIVLFLVLFGISPNAWADKGFWGDGAWNMQYYSYGGANSWLPEGQKMGSTYDLGIMTTFYLKGCWVKTWSNDNWTTEKVRLYYWIDQGDGGNNYLLTGSKESNNDRTWTFDNCLDYNVIDKATNNGANPGVYTLKLKWKLDESDDYQSNECGVKFTYPGFTTTSTSKSYTAVVNNNSSQTISFGTHYGTTLSTSNCSITGTNSSDFTVTGISESGVTVKFAPSTVGTKSATLTITDAHSKTCTISLTGTAKPTAVTGFTQSVTDKLNGNGSNSNPYIIKYNTNVTVSLTADKWSDGNATLQFKVGPSGSWTTATSGTTGTATIKTMNIPTMDNVTIYYRYYNSANSIAGAESSTTIYYKSASYSVTLNANGGTIADGKDITSYNYGVGATLPTAPDEVSRAGYDFDGWFLNNMGDAVTEIGTSEYGNKSYTAHWTQNIQYYKVTLNIGENGSLTSVKDNNGNNVDVDNVVGGTTIIVTVTPNLGYEVNAWTCGDASKTGGNTYTTTISADTEIDVTFKETKYSVTISKGTGIESVTPSGVQQVGNVNPVGISAEVATGYTWSQWTASSANVAITEASSRSTTIKATGTGTVTATATENMSTIAISSNNTDYGTVNVNNASVGVTTTQQLVATNNYGYKFKTWTLTGGAVLASGQLTNATITIKGDGNGTAGTAQAIFEEDLSTGWYFVSSKFSWESTSHEFIKKTGESTGTIGYCTITMSLDEAPEFKIGNGTKLYANSGDKDTKTTMVADNCSGWTFDKTDGDYANSILKATIAGEYTIAYNSANKQVSVTYPQGVYLVGNFNSYAPTHPFVFNGNEGTVTVNLSEKNHVYDLKICDNGVWYRDQHQSTIQETCDNWQMEKHMDGTIFHIESKMNGNYVFTYNKETKILGVTYPGEIKIPVTVYLDGETASTVEVGEATHPTIEAVQYVNGKRFAGWQADEGVTLANANDRTTQITAVTGAGKSVHATYTTENMVYFKNTSWGTGQDIYVYLIRRDYNVWWNSYDSNDGPGVVLTKKDKTTLYAQYGKMTRLNDKSNIYYYDAGTLDNIGKVVFSQGDHHLSNSLYKTCAAYRADFNSCATMYVPETNPEQHQNETGYYNKGYWMKYSDIQSGYSIYLKNDKDYALVAESAGGNTFKTTINLVEPGKDYEFKIHGCNGSWYGNKGKMTSTNCSSWDFYEGVSENCRITTTSNGEYTFTLTCGDGVLYISVDYPLSEGDYRVVYTDSNHPCHPSTFIRKGEGNKDIVSFFIDKDKSPALKFQYCSAILGSTVTWTDVAGGTINISGITETGIYNFNLEQDASSISCTGHELYDGDFYIRTAIAPGGWDAYLGTDGNTLPYIEYGLDDSQPFKFTHAYTNWVEKDKNVKFCIANDYSLCISDTLVGDDILDTGGNADWLKNGANIRFMWNKNTNEVKRAYISGSTNDAEKFLTLENTNHKMYDKTGNTQINELKFDDKNNWVYQADIQAQPGCAVRLTAQYTIGTKAHKQYFIGSDTESKEIISGTGDKKYTMRAVYDFKTNRLTAGWIPDDGTIDTDIKLGGDMLLVREHQGKASQITFGETGRVSDIHHIYSVLTIKKDTMLGKADTKYPSAATNTDYERTMYWISFPFDVKISEVFGVDGYGKKWIMQRYNGEKRAEIGWFQETETFWEYLAPTSTLQAYKGYLLILNANYFNTDGADVWKNSATEANFYFPSAEKNIGIINKSFVDVPVPAHECGINRPFADGSGKNHTITDSHWNVIGVPAFQDAQAAATLADGCTLKSYYKWKSEDNTYEAETTMDGMTFKTMHAYMVQFGGTLKWTDVSVVNNPTPAPYHYADAKNYMIELFFNGNGAEDHTYINLADGASTDFVLNEDMMKIDNAGYPNIYSFAGAYDVAYNETKMIDQVVTIGVSAPADGSYTFSMPKDFSGSAILVDLEEGTATDLNLSNYSVDLNKGTYNNRFQLMLKVEASTPTNIDNVDGGKWNADGKTKKLLINDNIYLINAGRIYNATGTMVR